MLKPFDPQVFQPCFARRWVLVILCACLASGVFLGWFYGGIAGSNQETRAFLEAQAYAGDGRLLSQVISKHMAFMLKLAFLGLSLPGFPILAVMIFSRGFSWGYSFCCLLGSERLAAGYFKAVMVMIPHNLIALPAAVLMACAASNLSIDIFQAQWEGDHFNRPFLRQLSQYVAVTVVFFVLGLGASIIEAYLAPLFYF
jgi:stage II sporulation protein M